MLLQLAIEGLPPKKDGANSMWRKGGEVVRLKALRLAAIREFAETSGGVPDGALRLTLRVFAPVGAGDLDNFITGVCDGLMAAHPRVPIDATVWLDVPQGARPDRAIAFRDDGQIAKIEAERCPVDEFGVRYELELAPHTARAEL